MIKLVIFDLDGVLLDSEPLHIEARERLMRKFGITDPVEDMVGVSNKETWDPIIKKYNICYTQPQIERMQHEIVIDIIKKRKIELSQGCKELFEYILDNNIKMAIASSSARWFVEQVLENYHITKLFDVVMTGNEIENSKPNPEIYNKTLEKCSNNPIEAIAIEDSDTGQTSATKAGIKCIGYVNPTSGYHKLSDCFAKVNKLSEIIDILKDLAR